MAISAIPTHPSSFACIDLINSRFSDHLGRHPDHDRLPLARWQAWFMRRHGLAGDLTSVPVNTLLRLRSDLRRILDRWAQTGTVSAADAKCMDRWISAAAMRRRAEKSPSGLSLRMEPVRRDWTWITSAIAASAVELMSSTGRGRLKTCANPDCSWMFHDSTLNASRRFCSTQPCANLTRVREFRARHA